ncbi:MAG: acetyl-CoA carboxylase biotin carboxyl carrier protein [Pirellulaceae bacterium]
MTDSEPPQGTEPSQGTVFNVDKIRALIELMKDHDLSELDLREGEQKIQLKRGSQAPLYQPVAPAPAPLAQAPSAPAAAAPAAASDDHLIPIKSPMVGTFYARPKPDSENFVRTGESISEDTVVCIIEAMKVFNDIKAEISGKVVKMLVKNEDAVEYGQTLFLIDPQG